jgi:LacI family transcriptional regulator
MGKPYRVGLAWQMDRRYGEEAIRGIAQYSKRYGPWLFYMEPIQNFAAQRLAKPLEFDGILVGHDDLEEARRMEWSKAIPAVSVHQVYSHVAPWRVQPDNQAVGRMAAEEFLKLGLRQFAFCPHSNMSPTTVGGDFGRLGGFTSHLRKHGAVPIMYDGPVGQHGFIKPRRRAAPLSRWLAALPKPIGIFAGSDQRARDLLLSAESAGVRIPEDAAIIGVNNEAWAEVLFRGLSSIELDAFGAGYAAAGLLHQLMDGRKVEPGIMLIPPRGLVRRRSSSMVVIDDPDVALAVRFIGESATSGIGVRHVVDAVPLSRRSLERRFQEVLGHSVLHEIHHARVERAKLLLVDQTVTMRRVADVAGFGSVKSLRVAFTRLVGMTPAAYRARHASVAASAIAENDIE